MDDTKEALQISINTLAVKIDEVAKLMAEHDYMTAMYEMGKVRQIFELAREEE